MRRMIWAGTAVAGLMLAAVPSAAAGAAPDTTGPTIKLQPIAHLVVPATVTTLGGVAPFSTGVYQTSAIQKWSATDPSGICDYQLWDDYAGRADPTLTYEGMATSYRFNVGDIDESDGGYNLRSFALRVQDCAGNWSTTEPEYWPTDRPLPQSAYSSLATFDDPTGTYSAGWTHSSCLCFAGGTDSHAATAGASVSFTYKGEIFGLMLETGPTRGSAKIYQDGVLAATVNTYAAANTGPRIMWANWFASSATHTIKVVIVGTAGHPRVDVDGVFVGPPYA